MKIILTFPYKHIKTYIMRFLQIKKFSKQNLKFYQKHVFF